MQHVVSDVGVRWEWFHHGVSRWLIRNAGPQWRLQERGGDEGVDATPFIGSSQPWYVRIAGIAFGWIGSTMPFGAIAR
jgi:hypothetical protein